MDAPLSSYWVRFFKSAGFPTDVSTRYAVIFSNNRIKPDMLPELDKPTLKEMGISLMGDMIAILRYAKKVVDETTCKKLLDEDSPPPVKSVSKQPVKKTICVKSSVKPTAVKKVRPEPPKMIKTSNSSVKSLKSTSNSNARLPSTALKKAPPMTGTSKLYSDYIDTTSKPKISQMKRKYDSDEDDRWFHNGEMKYTKKIVVEDDDEEDDVDMYLPPVKVRKPMMDQVTIIKRPVPSKKTVFHRLGDSMVSSTTNIDSVSSNFTPAFTVTGIGKDTRADSVFGRLGNKSSEIKMFPSQRNGSTKPASILKTRTPLHGTKVFTSKTANKPLVGTMRADEEQLKKATSVPKKLARSSTNFKPRENPLKNTGLVKRLPTTRKLASDTKELSAKSRLGMNKQVTFNYKAKINHIKKDGVFSRLGKY